MPAPSSTLHPALWNVLSGPHQQPSSCDWLPAPTSHLAVWNALIHRDPRTVAPTSQENTQKSKPQSALTEFLTIMQTSTMGHYYDLFLLRQKQRAHVPLLLLRLGSVRSLSMCNTCCTTNPVVTLPLFQTPIFWPSGSRQSLATCWHTSGGAQRRIWQHAACPGAGSLVAVTQSPRRETSSEGATTERWLVRRD